MQKMQDKLPCSKKALFICLVMLAIPPLMASGQETYRFERMWPTLPQPWYFNKPDGIAVGRDGLVYVFDTNYARVQKYTRDGLFITTWGKEGLGDGEFGICAGCNLRNGIALDDNGNVYVTDTINHRIQKFTRDGTFITKWGKNNGDGTSGTENGAFNYPSDIAVDGSGYVYVTDYFNHRVQKFTATGNFVKKWGKNQGDGSYGTGENEFVQPSSVTVDPGGFVLVADEINDRIQKFTSEGTFILMWDNAHPNGAQLNRPRDLTTDADGNIYVTNIGSTNSPSNKIHKINQNGQLLESWDTVPFASGVALDASGFMYVTDMGLNRIIILTPGGVIANIWGSYQDGENQLQFPDGIAVENGYVYVTEILSQRIKTFTLDGTDIASWGGTGTEDGKFHDTRGITADDSGNVFVCDRYNYRIQKFTAEGEFITKWGSGDNLPLRPEGIAVDMSGNVYVAESQNQPWPSRVQKFIPNPDGTEYAPDGTWNIWGNNEEFYNLYDIAVGSDETGTGYVYVTDWRDPSLSLPYYYYIHKFTLNGNYITSWTEAVPGDAFNRPWGLATDDSGNVYVSDSDNYRVLKFNPEGQLLASFGSLGSAPGLDRPG